MDELAFAAAIALGGAIVLLVLGTQVLDWYWLVLLAAAGLVFGAWRGSRKLTSRYDLARTLDRNLELKDALSTAFYFSEHPERTKSPRDVVEGQRIRAEELARGADVHRGLPMAFSRSVYVGGGLALAALGVFGLRYGVTRTLDLRPSLIEIAFDGFLNSRTVLADAKPKPANARSKDWANPSTLKYDPWQAQTIDQKGAPDSALDTVDEPNVDNSNKTGPAANSKANGAESKDSPDSSADNPDNADAGSKDANQSPDGSHSPSKQSSQGGVPPPNAQQRNQNAGESSSLTDKMRDALANLLSKLKMQPKNGSGKTGGKQSNQDGGKQMAQNRQANQNGSPSPGQPQQDAMASPEGQPNQDPQGADQAKSGQGKSTGKSESQSKSQDGKSGIGRQDGDKSIKEAEQLAAMGKISQIIGKRSQNVTGEVMVEVGSGNQQLRTQYSQKRAAHSDAGGEISRDEVPLAYQQYVQQYFEEIRKLPATGAKATKSARATKKPGN